MTTVKVISNIKLTSECFVLRTEKLSQSLIPGQCFSIGVPSVAINREYSIYSGSPEPHYEFLIRRVEGGIVSNALFNLRAGDLVDIWGPFGAFTLDHSLILKNRYVFIASGTGIAPFHSYVKSYPGLSYKIIHGVRYETERYNYTEYANETYFPCISQPMTGNVPMRVTDFIKIMEVKDEEIFYLCGNRNMINDSIRLLKEKGVLGNRIFTETFF